MDSRKTVEPFSMNPPKDSGKQETRRKSSSAGILGDLSGRFLLPGVGTDESPANFSRRDYRPERVFLEPFVSSCRRLQEV
jgi:hypothetical protein